MVDYRQAWKVRKIQKCLAEMNSNECRHAHDRDVVAINVGCMKPWMNYEPRLLKELLEAN